LAALCDWCILLACMVFGAGFISLARIHWTKPLPCLPFFAPPQLEARLAALTETCTYAVFSFARRGLFDRDKLVFTTLLATQIMLRVGAAGGQCVSCRFLQPGRLAGQGVQT